MLLRAVAVLCLVLLSGCVEAGSPQKGLRTETIVIDTANGPVRLVVEIADTMGTRQQGLMYRRELAANSGMLFLYDNPQQVNFWMHNTPLPLDMIFVRANGTISSIAQNVRPMSDARTSSREPVVAVIEINAGRAAALGIRDGDRVHAQAFRNAVP